MYRSGQEDVIHSWVRPVPRLTFRRQAVLFSTLANQNKNAAGAFAPSAAGDGIAEQPTSITDRIPHGESVTSFDLIDTRVSLSNNSDPQGPKGDF